MLRWLRPLLFWLLIATLPLKGLAAVVWAGCGPAGDGSAAHEHQVVASSTADPGWHPHAQGHADAHAHSSHWDPGVHDHQPPDHFGGLAGPDASSPDDATPDAGTGTDASSSHCHHSAPCCTVVAPAPALPGMNLPLAPTQHGVTLATEPADVVMDVPHRPPRHPLV